jgi:hypothetical protein
MDYRNLCPLEFLFDLFYLSIECEADAQVFVPYVSYLLEYRIWKIKTMPVCYFESFFFLYILTFKYLYMNYDFDIIAVNRLLDKIITYCDCSSVVQSFLHNSLLFSLIQSYVEIVLEPIPPMVGLFLIL